MLNVLHRSLIPDMYFFLGCHGDLVLFCVCSEMFIVSSSVFFPLSFPRLWFRMGSGVFMGSRIIRSIASSFSTQFDFDEVR